MTRLMLIGLAGLLLSACASGPVQTDRYYRLESVLADASPVADPPYVSLEPFEAHGIYAERPLVYRRPAGQGALEQFAHLFWAELPTRMLSDGLDRSLRGVLGDEHVHGRSSRKRIRYVVRPRLRRLDFCLDPEGQEAARAEFATDFLVTDEAREPRFVVSFSQTRELAAPTTAEFVRVVSAMAAEANRQLIQRLAEEFPREP